MHNSSLRNTAVTLINGLIHCYRDAENIFEMPMYKMSGRQFEDC